MERENKLDLMITGTMDKLREFVDVNTVIGRQIDFDDGTTIIPISKVTTGYLTGGGEYGELKLLKPDAGYPCGGANGAVISMKPSGFLVHSAGSVKLIPVSEKPYEKLIDLAAEILEKLTEKVNETNN